MKIKNVVEFSLTHFAHELEKRLRPTRSLENINLIDRLADAHQGRKHLAHDPRNAQIWALRLQRRGDLEAVHDVAEG